MSLTQQHLGIALLAKQSLVVGLTIILVRQANGRDTDADRPSDFCSKAIP